MYADVYRFAVYVYGLSWTAVVSTLWGGRERMEKLLAEMDAYYAPLRQACLEGTMAGGEATRAFRARREAVWAAMDRFAADHPDTAPVLLKARLHEEIAARCEPAIFPHSPFFFEMGMRPAENWGTPSPHAAASWMKIRYTGLYDQLPEQAWIRACHFHAEASAVRLWGIWDAFDADHHALGMTRLLRTGIDGVLADIELRQGTAVALEQQAFLEAAARSCRALLRIAARFAAKAARLKASATDPQARRFLGLIAETAGRIPAQPPRTFYEGLAAVLFLREGVASLEGVGISVLGHMDRLLGDLYAADRAAGRLTESEARDLIARWLPHTDVKFHLADNPWPETSTCIELGGCDADGQPVFNAVTRLFVEVHQAQGRANPKLNCRFSSISPPAYLDLLCRSVLAGHNHFALLNDEVLIPALVRAGKAEREARLYVNGGCQETIVEGVEHSAGAYFYLNGARILDLVLQPLSGSEELPPEVRAVLPLPADGAGSFEAFYRHVLDAFGRVVQAGCTWVRALGARWPAVNPCPLFSSSLEGCIESASDYTAGGARHNPAGLALVGFGTVVDSLWAVRQAVFAEGWLSLAELRQALARNWAGAEALRQRLVALPKYGHGEGAVDEFAARLASDWAAVVRRQQNERGGFFQPSFFVYYFFVRVGEHVRATPDGRFSGAWLSQGVSPGRVRPTSSLTDAMAGLARLDLRDYPGNAVLDTQLPLAAGLEPETLASCLRTFARLGGATLQPNCISPAALRDAQRTPADHRDLMVRLSGLSARFVALDRSVQDEFIDRVVARV